jgi:hypothetical protein
MTRGTEFLFEVHGDRGDLTLNTTTCASMQRQLSRCDKLVALISHVLALIRRRYDRPGRAFDMILAMPRDGHATDTANRVRNGWSLAPSAIISAATRRGAASAQIWQGRPGIVVSSMKGAVGLHELLDLRND